MKNLHLANSTFQILKPHFIQLVFVYPLAHMETQPTVQSSEQHVAGLSAYFFGVVAETRQHGPFAIVLVPGVFQSEVIFDSVDGDVGGCDYDEFIGRNITDMQDGLLVGIFFLYNFFLGDSIIDP